MINKFLASATAAGLIAAATAAHAQTQASALTDLNLRAEPNPMGEILAVIPTDGAVTVEGCAEVLAALLEGPPARVGRQRVVARASDDREGPDHGGEA